MVVLAVEGDVQFVQLEQEAGRSGPLLPPSGSYRSRHMTWHAMRPVFVIDSLRTLVGPGQRSRMAPTHSRRTIFAADYFVDEDAATMLEYVERLKRSD